MEKAACTRCRRLCIYLRASQSKAGGGGGGGGGTIAELRRWAGAGNCGSNKAGRELLVHYSREVAIIVANKLIRELLVHYSREVAIIVANNRASLLGLGLVDPTEQTDISVRRDIHVIIGPTMCTALPYWTHRFRI